MLRLRLQAPFAAFRPFTAGWYRPTAGFLTPSAAYGLALNLAGIETRRDDGLSAMTVTSFGLPRARIAVGADPDHPLPAVQTMFQQLHNYPVGVSGKEQRDDTKGNKYNITPVRREFLSGLFAVVALNFDPDEQEIEAQIRAGLAGESPRSGSRYGLPFLGDNAFLLDRIEILDESVPVVWYCRPDAEDGVVSNSTRLTTWIDRRDMSRTRSAVYAPSSEASSEIPDAAWTLIEPPSGPVSATSKPRKRS
jgi:CRISPR-associated protein Cas5t